MSVLGLSISRNTLCLSRRVTDWLSSLHKMNDIKFQKKNRGCYFTATWWGRFYYQHYHREVLLTNYIAQHHDCLSCWFSVCPDGRRFTVYTGGRDGTGGGRPLAGEWLTHWLRLRGRARYYVVLLTITTSHSLTLYSDTACHRADTFAFYIEEIIDRYAYYNVLANRHYGVKRFSTQT